jgi:hypothetical protein
MGSHYHANYMYTTERLIYRLMYRRNWNKTPKNKNQTETLKQAGVRHDGGEVKIGEN